MSYCNQRKSQYQYFLNGSAAGIKQVLSIFSKYGFILSRLAPQIPEYKMNSALGRSRNFAQPVLKQLHIYAENKVFFTISIIKKIKLLTLKFV